MFSWGAKGGPCENQEIRAATVVPDINKRNFRAWRKTEQKIKLITREEKEGQTFQTKNDLVKILGVSAKMNF